MMSKMSGKRLAVESDHHTPLDRMIRAGVRGRADVSALASLDGDKLCVLVWHYHDDGVAGDDAAVELVLVGLPIEKGEARLRHFRIDEEHSNAFNLWKSLGEPQQPTSEQYKQLEQAGKLAEVKVPDRPTVKNRQATIRFALPRQAVSLIEISM
jgi:xylan 1,4-beta-xylosidase